MLNAIRRAFRERIAANPADGLLEDENEQVECSTDHALDVFQLARREELRSVQTLGKIDR